jgi:F-type H+-transporting ATPase subunit epsilon
MELEIATPERQLVREDVTEVQIPGKNGYMGILPGHAPLLSELGTGILTYVTGGRRKTISLQGGFVEVQPENVRVLANIAQRAEEIDLGTADTDLKRAEQEVINPALGADPAVALEAMKWAQARVDAAKQK